MNKINYDVNYGFIGKVPPEEDIDKNIQEAI